MDPLSPRRSHFRTLLILGRASNLPTVWSNCLAGWLLGGGGAAADLLLLSVAATFLYTGGMYLNDAFDAEFDRQHRPDQAERHYDDRDKPPECLHYSLGVFTLARANLLTLLSAFL